MLDLKFIRENLDLVKKGVAAKGRQIDFTQLMELDHQRREILKEGEQLKADRNKKNEEIARLKKANQPVEELIRELKLKSQKIDEFDRRVVEISSLMDAILIKIPNIPHSSVLTASDPRQNQAFRSWGSLPRFNFKPQDHLRLGEVLEWFSFERSSRMTGSGFVLFQKEGARIVRALVNFMLDLHTHLHGYTEVFPPFIVNRESMFGTGQLPLLEADMYQLKEDGYFLIPTAEVPVTNLHRDEVLEEESLPRKYVAYTACFRREAGSYGKETRGLIRVHQFDKVELVKFTHPDRSFEELELLLHDAEEVLQRLGLPYRVVELVSGDLSFAASKCYDLEVWSAGSEKWLEVSSCSNFTDFQARRAEIRFRPKGTNKSQYLHTLNASGVAIPRTLIALMENNQREDGSIEIPACLKPYLESRLT